MAKSNVNKSSQKKASAGKPRMQHRFQMREMLFADADNKIVANTTPSGGAVSGFFVVTPIGSISAKISGTSFVPQRVLNSQLRWLSNQSYNFGHVRMLRAKLIVVGNVGSTATGTITLQGFTDVMDVQAPSSSTMSKLGKCVDLATLSSKECVLNLPVDSSWKKVAKSTCTVGGIAPFAGDAATLITLNSVNDLFMTAVGYNIVNATHTGATCSFFLDYEVEFKDPIDASVNN